MIEADASSSTTSPGSAPPSGAATIVDSRYVEPPEPTRVVGAVLEVSSADEGTTGRRRVRRHGSCAGRSIFPASERMRLRDWRVDDVVHNAHRGRAELTDLERRHLV